MQTQRITLSQEPPLNEAYLVPFSRPGSPTLPIGDFFTVGRDTTCQLVLNDPFVSSRHARIERKNGVFSLRDMQSSNGTYLNGSRVTEAVLTANDQIRFGETVYMFSETPAETLILKSRNEAWSAQLGRLTSFAATDFAVLITGPSGSGKEILARAVHRHSSRGRGPFVSINCSALSESLIESELFGHVKGSFTGATHDRKGAFEAARGGTLFLDEIGDLPVSLQPKLLRALENNEIRPVGSDRALETDVRIISATHQNLPSAIRGGRFREDLFYRLNVCQMQPPALRERMEDFEDILYQFAKQYRVRFSFTAVQKLKELPWQGNIRELKNAVARASAYFPAKQVMPEDLPSLMEAATTPPEVHFVTEPSGSIINGSIIKEIEREMIVRRLQANNGNQRRTAKDLGLPKSTLHDRIKTYSIDLSQIGKVEAVKA